VAVPVAPEIHGAGGLLGAREVLEMATLGGAAVLGRTDVGSLEAGKCADFIAIDLDRIGYSGARHDPVAAAVFCNPGDVDFNFVHGKAVVRQGRLVKLDQGVLVEAHNRAAMRLAND
jgi:8-oxoguanine deaminase